MKTYLKKVMDCFIDVDTFIKTNNLGKTSKFVSKIEKMLENSDYFFENNFSNCITFPHLNTKDVKHAMLILNAKVFPVLNNHVEKKLIGFIQLKDI